MMAPKSTPNRWAIARLAVATALLLILSGCARYVVTDYDQQARFDQYQTYTLISELDEDAEHYQTLDSRRIETALKRELGEEGLTEVDNRAEADVLVRYWIEDARRIESTGVSYGLGFGRSPFGFGMATAPRAREVKEEKLIVELMDAQSRQVIWRATSQRNLDEHMSPKRRTELINRIAHEMFERYPPQ